MHTLPFVQRYELRRIHNANLLSPTQVVIPLPRSGLLSVAPFSLRSEPPTLLREHHGRAPSYCARAPRLCCDSLTCGTYSTR